MAKTREGDGGSPYRPFKPKKKRPKYKQLELPLAKYGGKAKFKNDPRTKPNV